MEQPIATPETADHVTLHLSCCDGAPHHSQIQRMNGPEWRVAAPLLHPGGAPAEPFAAGEELGVCWPFRNGAWVEQPCRFVDEARVDHHNWRVALAGDPVVVQRREYARVTHIAPMRLCSEGAWLASTMVDVSEGGVSCAVVDGALPQPGAPLLVELPIGDELVTVGAAVVRSLATPSGESLVAVRFTGVDTRLGDRIRREVFALQLQQRARA